MAETYERRDQVGNLQGTYGSGADVEGAKSTLKARSAEGLGSRGKAGKGPMPKQRPGESASDYGDRLRKWRLGDDDDKAEVVSRATRK